jgi:hypothetical protein
MVLIAYRLPLASHRDWLTNGSSFPKVVSTDARLIALISAQSAFGTFQAFGIAISPGK